jgi:3-carboxy-cis,cis-muconate cycloisomerase
VAMARAAASGIPLRDVLLDSPEIADKLSASGITPGQVEQALDPVGYLGASGAFIDAALAAHRPG